MDGRFDKSRVALRALCALVYLGTTVAWALFMLLVAIFSCDESCVGSEASNWTDNPYAWQWDAIGWLGVAGVVLAVVAVAGGFFRREVGIAGLVAHAAVFAASLVLASPATNGIVGAVLVPALVAWAAAVGSVVMRVRNEPPNASRAAPPATS